MKRLVLLLAAAAAFALPPAAAAHPLGNFTVNRHVEIVASGRVLYLVYTLDLAEIPTLQEGARERAPALAREAARFLVLELDGQRVPLELVERRVVSRPGAGGLETLRLDAIYRANGQGRRLTFRDANFASRIGWREIVARAERGAQLLTASVPRQSASARLRSYPQDRLRAPLDVRGASATISLGSAPGVVPELDAAPAAARKHGFEALIAGEKLGFGVVLAALALAAFWGAAHALTPGHGKAIVAGYLVGARGKPRHAFALGLIVTVTHTIGVFALGLVTLALSQFLLPEQLYPWLTLVAGLLVVCVGASVLWTRWRHVRAHRHGHDHHHHHDHELSGRNLLGIGVAAGLIPCPSALVVLLSAIALHRIGLGLALIVAFSVGLAATITAIGLVAVLARRAFSRVRLDGPLVRALPALSAGAILIVGLVLTVRALPGVV